MTYIVANPNRRVVRARDTVAAEDIETKLACAHSREILNALFDSILVCVGKILTLDGAAKRASLWREKEVSSANFRDSNIRIANVLAVITLLESIPRTGKRLSELRDSDEVG